MSRAPRAARGEMSWEKAMDAFCVFCVTGMPLVCGVGSWKLHVGGDRATLVPEGYLVREYDVSCNEIRRTS